MIKTVFILACALLCISGTAEAKRIGVVSCNEKSKVCRITNNPGGDVNRFLATAKEIRRRGYRLEVNGFCASSCVLLADQLKGRACITRTAKFGFHKGVNVEVDLRTGRIIRRLDEFTPPHSAAIAKWVKNNGGFPSNLSGEMRWMPNKVARKFWKTC